MTKTLENNFMKPVAGKDNNQPSVKSIVRSALPSKNKDNPKIDFESEEDRSRKKMQSESNQSLAELAELEQELGLESFSEEIRQLDDDIKVDNKNDATGNSEGDSSSRKASEDKKATSETQESLDKHLEINDGSLEDELKDLDAELALLGDDNDFDEGDLDDADFADLEKEFEEIDGL